MTPTARIALITATFLAAMVPAGCGGSNAHPDAPMGGNITGSGFIEHNASGLPATDSVDFAKELPRTATSGALDKTDPARPSLSWTVTGSDTVTDVTEANVTWTDGGNNHSWILITNPQENGPVQVPAMPSALAGFAPTATASYQSATVLYIAASWETRGWDAIRQAGGALAKQPATDFKVAVTSPSFRQACSRRRRSRLRSCSSGRAPCCRRRLAAELILPGDARPVC